MKTIIAIVLSANIFFTFAKADDEIPLADEIIVNPDQQTKIAQVLGQTELNQINDKNILSPEYTGVLQSGKLHYGVGIAYEIRQKLVKLACGLTLPQFEFMISDAATKLTNKSFNDATLRILAEDIVATGVGAKDNNRMQQNSNERISALKQNVANNVLQSVNSGSVRLINQGVLKAAMSLDKPYSCRNRIAIDHFQALANEMKSKNIQAYQKFLQMFKFNCSYCEDQYSASVKIAQLQASSEHSDNNKQAMGATATLVVSTGKLFTQTRNPPLSAGIAVFGGVGIAAYWTSKEAKINNIESASKELAKTQFDMCKNDCSNTSDAQAAKESKEKYNKGSESVSKEFNSTNRLLESEKPEEIGKQKFTKQEEDKVKNINPKYDYSGPENLDEKLSVNVCKSILDRDNRYISYSTYESAYEDYTKKLSKEMNSSLDSAITRIRGFLRNDPRIQFNVNKFGSSDTRLADLANNIEKGRDNIIARTNYRENPFAPSLNDYAAKLLNFSNAKRMEMEIKWLRNNQDVFCQ